MHTRLITLLLTCVCGLAAAQTPPSPAEIASYRGLHRAAHEGRAADIREPRQAARTWRRATAPDEPRVHAAAFASHDEALAALAHAGADLNALDASAYDAVTIAAVANDPELMSLAISLGNSPAQVTSPYDGTALIAAAHLGHAEVVARLAAAGALRIMSTIWVGPR
ncbi:MAG: hypothetical protein R3E83_00435 [Burkholderiaceae bacterium]